MIYSFIIKYLRDSGAPRFGGRYRGGEGTRTYLIRTECGTLGTAHILPPLPYVQKIAAIPRVELTRFHLRGADRQARSRQELFRQRRKPIAQ
jgi:hypothetical protein